MASCPITSWQINGETVETVAGFIFLGAKITADSDCSNEIKRHLLFGHHQMVNTEIRLIIFFAAKDGDTLYSPQKQERELTVAQIMNSLLPNSDLN